MANVDYLPIWKKNATDGERLRELAMIADKHPDRFRKWVLVYCEDDERRFKVRMMEGKDTRTSDAFGVLSAGIQQLWEDTRL